MTGSNWFPAPPATVAAVPTGTPVLLSRRARTSRLPAPFVVAYAARKAPPALASATSVAPGRLPRAVTTPPVDTVKSCVVSWQSFASRKVVPFHASDVLERSRNCGSPHQVRLRERDAAERHPCVWRGCAGRSSSPPRRSRTGRSRSCPPRSGRTRSPGSPPPVDQAREEPDEAVSFAIVTGAAPAGVVESLNRSRRRSSSESPHTTARFAPSLAVATTFGPGSGPKVTGPSVRGPTTGGSTGSHAPRAITPTSATTASRPVRRTMVTPGRSR